MTKLWPHDIIYLPASKFNAYRDDRESKLDPLPTLKMRGSQYVGSDLRKHRLNGLSFFRVVFEGAVFGDIEGVKFNSCTFTDCSFSNDKLPRGGAFGGATISDVTFYNCHFSGTDFSGNDLDRVRFREPICKNAPHFLQCRVSNYVLLDQKNLSSDFLLNLTRAIFLPDCRIALSGSVIEKRVSWETVRTLGKLPFLQVSFIGLILFSFLAVFLAGFLSDLRAAQGSCVDMGADTQIPSALVDRFCHQFNSISASLPLADRVLFFFFNSVALFAAALIQLLKCPSEILEFSRTSWESSLRRPPEAYLLLAQQEAVWCWISILLYSVSLASIAGKTLIALYQIG